MKKEIANFRNESYGLFIDLAEGYGRIGVDRQSGDILLDEGDGPNHFHGAVIEAEAFCGFDLQESEPGQLKIVLRYGNSDSHLLGLTGDIEAAQTWTTEATKIIRAHRPGLTSADTKKQVVKPEFAPVFVSYSHPSKPGVLAAPEKVPNINIFTDTVRVVHPPGNYGQFQHRREFDQLMEWAKGKGQRERVCVLSGIGGSGKSSLALHFLLSNCPSSIAGYRGSRASFQGGFYYSFYADPSPANFLRALTHWLKPAGAVPKTAAKMYAMLRNARNSLFVLDGFEAVQHAASRHTIGGLSLSEFFAGVVKGSAGKGHWLITSRQADWFKKQVRSTHIELGPMNTTAAISLLRSRGVGGDKDTLRRLASTLGNHPLALDMAGHYIREFGWSPGWTRRIEASDSGIDFRIIIQDFLGDFAKHAPEANGLLLELCATVPNSQPFHLGSGRRSIPVLDVKTDERLRWGVGVLTRSGIIATYTEHDGHVSKARGGASVYTFEPEVEARPNPHWKVFVQLGKLREILAEGIQKLAGSNRKPTRHQAATQSAEESSGSH